MTGMYRLDEDSIRELEKVDLDRLPYHLQEQIGYSKLQHKVDRLIEDGWQVSRRAPMFATLNRGADHLISLDVSTAQRHRVNVTETRFRPEETKSHF